MPLDDGAGEVHSTHTLYCQQHMRMPQALARHPDDPDHAVHMPNRLSQHHRGMQQLELSTLKGVDDDVPQGVSMVAGHSSQD